MGKCIHCGKEVTTDSQGAVRELAPDVAVSQYCWMDPVHGSQLHEMAKSDILLDQYAQENHSVITLEELIDFHRKNKPST